MKRYSLRSILMIFLIGLLALSLNTSAFAHVVSVPQMAVSSDPQSDPTPTPAPTETPITYDPNIHLTVQYDYDGNVRPGFTVPAFIEITNNGAAIDGELRLSLTPEETVGAIVYKQSVHIDEHTSTSFTIPFQALSTRNIQVHLYRNNETAAVAAADIKSTGVPLTFSPFVGILTDNPQDMAYWLALKALMDVDGYMNNVTPILLDDQMFPDQQHMLARFSLIVLNHYDLNLLNQMQRDALTGWVESGGVLLADADSANSQAIQSLNSILDVAVTGEAALTGITEQIFEIANTAYTNQASIASLGIVEPAGNVIHNISDPSGNEVDGYPLLHEYSVGKGRVFLTTFPLNAAALTHSGVVEGFFGKTSGLNSIPLNVYDQNMNSYNSRQGTLDQAVRSIPWLDAMPIGWILLLLAVFIVLVGPVNYLILSAKRKRDLIWITAPVLSVIFCVVIIGIGVHQHGSVPVSSIVTVADTRGGQQMSYSEIGIGAPHSGSYEISLKEEGIPNKNIQTYYYYDMNNVAQIDLTLGEPAILFDQGGLPKVTIPSLSRWSMDSFSFERSLALSGTLEGNVFYNSNQSTYKVHNSTDIDLEDVTLLTPLGYARIPFLTAGETRNGMLEAYAGNTQNVSYVDYWQYLQEIYGGPNYPYWSLGIGNEQEDTRTPEELRDDYLKFSVSSSFINWDSSQNYYASQTQRFPIWAWSESYGAIDLDINGTAPRNDLNLTAILGEVTFLFESDGKLSIPYGFLPGMISNIDQMQNGWAEIGSISAGLVSGELIFDFQLPDYAQDYTFDTISFSYHSQDGLMEFSLLNVATGEWDVIDFTSVLEGETAASYVNADGLIQLKVYKQDDGMEAYIDNIQIAVEGTVR